MQQSLEGLPPFAAAPGFALDLGNAMTRASLQAMSDFYREWAKFLSGRLEKDAALQSELANCTSPFEALDRVARFWEILLKDCAAETQTVQALAATSAERGMGAIEAGIAPAPAPILD